MRSFRFVVVGADSEPSVTVLEEGMGSTSLGSPPVLQQYTIAEYLTVTDALELRRLMRELPPALFTFDATALGALERSSDPVSKRPAEILEIVLNASKSSVVDIRTPENKGDVVRPKSGGGVTILEEAGASASATPRKGQNFLAKLLKRG